jgi:hypothetical protein
MHPSPVALALPPHCPHNHPVRLDLHILDETPLSLLALLPAVQNPLPIPTPPLIFPQARAQHHPPRRPLHQPQRRADNPLYPVFRVCDVCVEGDGGVPQAFWEGVHVIGYAVVFGSGRRCGGCIGCC